jgi:hypothetical protein
MWAVPFVNRVNQLRDFVGRMVPPVCVNSARSPDTQQAPQIEEPELFDRVLDWLRTTSAQESHV